MNERGRKLLFFSRYEARGPAPNLRSESPFKHHALSGRKSGCHLAKNRKINTATVFLCFVLRSAVRFGSYCITLLVQHIVIVNLSFVKQEQRGRVRKQQCCTNNVGQFDLGLREVH